MPKQPYVSKDKVIDALSYYFDLLDAGDQRKAALQWQNVEDVGRARRDQERLAARRHRAYVQAAEEAREREDRRTHAARVQLASAGRLVVEESKLPYGARFVVRVLDERHRPTDRTAYDDLGSGGFATREAAEAFIAGYAAYATP